jgi:hypothetical protein
MPDPVKIKTMEEPWIQATILVPDDYLGAVLTLCEDRRGEQLDLTYAGSRAMVVYRLPLNEVVYDFYDRLKSVSRGYASFDYHIEGTREGDLVKVAILVNGEPVPGPGPVPAPQGTDPAPAVQDRDPGCHRRQGDRPGDRGRAQEGRHRQVLRRRRDPQAQAAG